MVFVFMDEKTEARQVKYLAPGHTAGQDGARLASRVPAQRCYAEAMSGPRVQAGKASICPQETLLLLGRQSAHMGQVAD